MTDQAIGKHKIVQRFAAADFILSELEKGRFPTLGKFLKNARFNLRQITKPEVFNDNEEQPDLQWLLAASRPSGMVHISMQPVPRISLFYDDQLSEAEAALFSSTLQKVVALAFTALGLDMSGLVSADEGPLPGDESAEKR